MREPAPAMCPMIVAHSEHRIAVVVDGGPMATDIGAVEQDCSVIRPHAGHVIFFDGREYPHYARPLTSGSDIRIAAVMNFYTSSFPEAERLPGTQRRLYRHEGIRLGRVRPCRHAEAVRRRCGTDGAAA